MENSNILVIDADPKNLQILRDSLESSDFSVITASDGQEAWEIIVEAQPDLVLSEVNIPTLDGFQLLEKLKAEPATSSIPVVFLTNRREIQDRVRSLRGGVKDYMIKPVHVKEVIARIRMILRRLERLKLTEDDASKKLVGRLDEHSVINLIENFGAERRNGVLNIYNENNRNGEIYFRGGAVVHATLGPLKSEKAVYQMLPWKTGHFIMSFKDVSVPDSISVSNLGLLLQGFKRMEERETLFGQLPSPETTFVVSDSFRKILTQKELSSDASKFISLINGKRDILQLIEDSIYDDIKCLQRLVKLHEQGFIVPGKADREITAEIKVTDSEPAGTDDFPAVHQNGEQAQEPTAAEEQPVQEEETRPHPDQDEIADKIFSNLTSEDENSSTSLLNPHVADSEGASFMEEESVQPEAQEPAAEEPEAEKDATTEFPAFQVDDFDFFGSEYEDVVPEDKKDLNGHPEAAQPTEFDEDNFIMPENAFQQEEQLSPVDRSEQEEDAEPENFTEPEEEEPAAAAAEEEIAEEEPEAEQTTTTTFAAPPEMPLEEDGAEDDVPSEILEPESIIAQPAHDEIEADADALPANGSSFDIAEPLSLSEYRPDKDIVDAIARLQDVEKNGFEDFETEILEPSGSDLQDEDDDSAEDDYDSEITALEAELEQEDLPESSSEAPEATIPQEETPPPAEPPVVRVAGKQKTPAAFPLRSYGSPRPDAQKPAPTIKPYTPEPDEQQPEAAPVAEQPAPSAPAEEQPYADLAHLASDPGRIDIAGKFDQLAQATEHAMPTFALIAAQGSDANHLLHMAAGHGEVKQLESKTLSYFGIASNVSAQTEGFRLIGISMEQQFTHLLDGLANKLCGMTLVVDAAPHENLDYLSYIYSALKEKFSLPFGIAIVERSGKRSLSPAALRDLIDAGAEDYIAQINLQERESVQAFFDGMLSDSQLSRWFS